MSCIFVKSETFQTTLALLNEIYKYIRVLFTKSVERKTHIQNIILLRFILRSS